MIGYIIFDMLQIKINPIKSQTKQIRKKKTKFNHYSIHSKSPYNNLCTKNR